jgi:hypothetical protein
MSRRAASSSMQDSVLRDMAVRFTGSISYAAEVYDAATGELKYAVISQQAPFAMDVTSSFGRLDAARTGVRHGAQELNLDFIKAGLLKASSSS